MSILVCDYYSCFHSITHHLKSATLLRKTKGDYKMADFLQDNLRVFVVPVEIMEVQDLDIYEQMVYIVLRSFTNPRESTAFPSYNTIAKLGRMSRRKAIDCVANLVEKGLLKKEVRLDVTKNRKIRNTSNLYTVSFPDMVHSAHPG